MRNYLIYDLESYQTEFDQETFNPITKHELKLGCYVKLGFDYNVIDHGLFNGITPQEIVQDFIKHYQSDTILVTFNGRSFDNPLLELTAMEYDLKFPKYYHNKYGPRNRYATEHVDLNDWFTNFNATKMGGLDSLSMYFGFPSKSLTPQQINDYIIDPIKRSKVMDYCMVDTINTARLFIKKLTFEGMITEPEQHHDQLIELYPQIRD